MMMMGGRSLLSGFTQYGYGNDTGLCRARHKLVSEKLVKSPVFLNEVERKISG